MREEPASSFHIADVLEKQGMILSVPVGTSMWPMLRNRRDNIVIKKTEERLHRYDVPLYQRRSGSLVLHRILKVIPEGYVICGDNQCQKEYVKEEQILGILIGFYRGDTFVDCRTNKIYHLYVKLWCFSVILRIPVLTARKIIHRLKRGIK